MIPRTLGEFVDGAEFLSTCTFSCVFISADNVVKSAIVDLVADIFISPRIEEGGKGREINF